MEKKLFDDINRCLDDNAPVALLTVIASSGSCPGKPGAMMTVRPDRSCLGTIGGGNLEHQAIEHALICMQRGEHAEVSFQLSPGGGLGMTCGGELRVFIRVFTAAPHLIIVGAGHIGIELYHLASHQGFRITVIDDREELLTPERFPDARRLLAADLAAQLSALHLTPESYVTIATKSHESDRQALEAVVGSNATYIGMIGSRSKIRAAMAAMQQKGVPKEQLEAVYAPMGLDIGSVAPREIALSIISEILLVKNHGSLQHMRELKGFSSSSLSKLPR